MFHLKEIQVTSHSLQENTRTFSPTSAKMATNSERQIGETLTDSLLMDIMTPGYLPDISALQVPTATYSGIILLYEFIHKHLVMCALISQVYVKTQYLVLTET